METSSRNCPKGAKKRKLRSDLSHSTPGSGDSQNSSSKKTGRPIAHGKKSLRAVILNSRMTPPSPAKSARASAQKAKAAIRSSSKATVTHLRPPSRPRRAVSDDEIVTALRVIYTLRLEREEAAALATDPCQRISSIDVLMGRASRYTGISEVKLYELWRRVGRLQRNQCAHIGMVREFVYTLDFEAIDLTGDDDDNFQDADLAEGDVEEEVWNADADGDINAEMEEDELEEE